MLFELGSTVATPAALGALESAGQSPRELLIRHSLGDWGDLDAEDKLENELSLKEGHRLLSAYVLRSGERVWILTEADRSVTTILLPDDY